MADVASVEAAWLSNIRDTHALVRDTAYATLSHSRRARMHARVAQVLADAPGRESEVARHWRSAGPQHVGKAWRAARRAAEAARHVFAHDEALELLEWALEVLEQDENATTADRYDLQMDLARTLQLIGNWVDLRPLVHRTVHAEAARDSLPSPLMTPDVRSCTHPRSAANRDPTSACSGPVALRHPTSTAYRCFVPDLAGFAGRRRVGPAHQHCATPA